MILFKLSIAAAAAFILSGCTSSSIVPSLTPTAPSVAPTRPPVTKPVPYREASPEKQNRFHEKMIAVATSTKEDPNYHRMALNTAERKAWFKDLMYRLWDRQITKAQFISEGLNKYPTHLHEFEFVANGLTKPN